MGLFLRGALAPAADSKREARAQGRTLPDGVIVCEVLAGGALTGGVDWRDGVFLVGDRTLEGVGECVGVELRA